MKEASGDFKSKFKKIIDFVHTNSPRLLSLWAENLVARLRGVDVKFGYCKDKRSYFARGDGLERYYLSRVRGYYLYRNGINKRGDFICDSYCLRNIDFKVDDVVIDCGANYGDLYIYLRRFVSENGYIAVEPSPDDYKVLRMNSPGSKCVQYALGDTSGEADFYLQSDDGDSSIVAPENYTNIIKVEVVRLDDLVKSMDIVSVKLLKIEAEGYEPEVLKGATSVFPMIKYIAVDGGPERGVEKLQTFSEITNLLLMNGFEMVDVYFPWSRALFINKMRV